jgi:hypothetical protein
MAPGWIKWVNCAAKHIIMDDLLCGILPVSDDEISAEEAWELQYEHMAEFIRDGVVFSQFKARLADHRAKVLKDMARSTYERDALTHDRLLHPRQMVNHRGAPVFDLSPANLQLREDIEDGKHLRMSPSQLRQSRIAIYGMFGLSEFKRRIYQAVRREKFINWMDDKRQKKYLSQFQKKLLKKQKKKQPEPEAEAEDATMDMEEWSRI